MSQTNNIPALAAEQNGNIGAERLVQSTPGSPQDRRPNSFEVIGSAESLVGRVSIKQNMFIDHLTMKICLRALNSFTRG